MRVKNKDLIVWGPGPSQLSPPSPRQILSRSHDRLVTHLGRPAQPRLGKPHTGTHACCAPVSGKVAAHRAEGFGEGAHHDVHVCGRYAGVLADAAAGGAHRADAVRLVEVQVRLQFQVQTR